MCVCERVGERMLASKCVRVCVSERDSPVVDDRYAIVKFVVFIICFGGVEQGPSILVVATQGGDHSSLLQKLFVTVLGILFLHVKVAVSRRITKQRK